MKEANYWKKTVKYSFVPVAQNFFKVNVKKNKKIARSECFGCGPGCQSCTPSCKTSCGCD